MPEPTDCERWRNDLLSLDGDACRYRHHLKDTDTKPGRLCDSDKQNSTHGCAHAFNYRLLKVIEEMTLAKVLGPELAQGYSSEIRRQKNDMFRDDAAYQTVSLTPGETSAMEHTQDTVIGRREEITAEMLSIIDKISPPLAGENKEVLTTSIKPQNSQAYPEHKSLS